MSWLLSLLMDEEANSHCELGSRVHNILWSTQRLPEAADQSGSQYDTVAFSISPYIVLY